MPQLATHSASAQYEAEPVNPPGPYTPATYTLLVSKPLTRSLLHPRRGFKSMSQPVNAKAFPPLPIALAKPSRRHVSPIAHQMYGRLRAFVASSVTRADNHVPAGMDADHDCTTVHTQEISEKCSLEINLWADDGYHFALQDSVVHPFHLGMIPSHPRRMPAQSLCR